MSDGEPGADLGDELEVDEEEISACAPYLACQMSCLERLTPRVNDTPFLGLAWGTKEAEYLLTRSEFVGGERVRNREQTHSDLPSFRPPKANSPTPACLDRYHHGGELQVVFLVRDPEGWRREVEEEQILPWGDHLSLRPRALD